MNEKAIFWTAAAFEILGARLGISAGAIVNQLTGPVLSKEEAEYIKRCLNAPYKLD